MTSIHKVMQLTHHLERVDFRVVTSFLHFDNVGLDTFRFSYYEARV
jgi:hypothetical protein